MPKADFSRAVERYPSVGMGEAEWLAVFDQRPDIMWRIFGDIYDTVKAEEDKRLGRRAMGRRPGRSAVSLTEFYDVVFREPFSNDPFTEALDKLMSGKTLSEIARLVPCDKGYLSRVLNGKVPLTLLLMERIAESVAIHPSYFLEWRAKYLSGLVESVLTERPNLAIGHIQRVQAGRRALEVP
jgi:hypothetical protein